MGEDRANELSVLLIGGNYDFIYSVQIADNVSSDFAFAC